MATCVAARLLRALRRLAGGDDERGEESGAMVVGVVMGALGGGRRALWGVLRSPGDRALKELVPSGLEAVARFAVFHGRPGAEESDEVAAFAVEALEADVPDAPKDAVLVFVRADKQARLYVRSGENGEVQRQQLEVVEGFKARDFLRAAGFAMVRCAVDIDAFGRVDVLGQLEGWKETLGDPSKVFLRSAGSGSSVIDASGADVTGSSAEEQSVGQLLGIETSSGNSAASKSKKKKSKKAAEADASKTMSDGGLNEAAPGCLASFEYGDITCVELLASLTANAESAPVLTVPPSRSGEERWQLHLDALVVLPTEAGVSTLVAAIRETLHHQTRELHAYIEANATSSIRVISFEHFPLVGASFPLTIAVAPESGNFMTSNLRPAQIHEAFAQPMDRPILDITRGCSLSAQASLLSASDVLFNVHEGLPPSGISHINDEDRDENCVVVDGMYGYYHYMQHGMRDKGWGCAYRSLQTLSSWLQLNHYASRAPPTHAEIQRALVSMGDKPTTFVGSTQWIGSLEVGYVLDELFDVSFRSLNVASGAKLPEVARELQHHFATNGSPVMMGGGQLAFTILGVDYDPRSGDCALLILDPHYTGGDDLVTIQTKTQVLEGYKAVPVSWRRTSTFSAKSFYNLCLPQRPPYALD